MHIQVTLSLAATIVAFSSVVLGKKLNLAYSAKLYGIAFLIVTFGAVDEETTGTSVFLLASMVSHPPGTGVEHPDLLTTLSFMSSWQSRLAAVARESQAVIPQHAGHCI